MAEDYKAVVDQQKNQIGEYFAAINALKAIEEENYAEATAAGSTVEAAEASGRASGMATALEYADELLIVD